MILLLLWLVTTPRFVVKISEILQKVIVFFLAKGDGIKTSFWHNWIAEWLMFSALLLIFFFILAIFRRKRVVKVGPKVLTLGPPLFHILQKFFKQCFCLLDYYLKLTTIIYLHESVNWKALRARNSFFWLNLIAPLVKYKLDNICGSIPWKTTQNRFKIIATLASLNFEPKLLSSRVM